MEALVVCLLSFLAIMLIEAIHLAIHKRPLSLWVGIVIFCLLMWIFMDLFEAISR